MIDWEPLVEAAAAAREDAHVPFSGYRVGAALLLDDGRVIAGCNVELSSLPISTCAEQTAIAKAVSNGRRPIVAVVVVTDSSPPAPPCGVCREYLNEFARDAAVLLANLDGERVEHSVAELLPHPFVLPR